MFADAQRKRTTKMFQNKKQPDGKRFYFFIFHSKTNQNYQSTSNVDFFLKSGQRFVIIFKTENTKHIWCILFLF